MSWQRQLSTLQQQARTKQQQGDADGAAALFEEALRILHDEEPGGPESVHAELAIRTDLGNLLRQRNRLEAAAEQFDAALAALETVDAGGLELPRLGTVLQLAAIHADRQQFDAAERRLSDVSRERIDAIADERARRFMMVDFLRLKGDLAHGRDEQAIAVERWLEAIEAAGILLGFHPPAAVMYARQFLERLVSAPPEVRGSKWWGGLLDVVDRVQKSLEEHVEAGAEGAKEQFVRIEVLRAEIARRAGLLSKAEDAIWRAIELEQSWMSRLGAMGLYTRLAVESDEALSAGALPRDEVEAGADELIEQLTVAAADLSDSEAFRRLARLWLRWVDGDRSVDEVRTALEEIGEGAEASPQLRTAQQIVRAAIQLTPSR